MIGKITKGDNFTGLCSYVLGKPDARLIGGGMASTTPTGLGAEFRALSRSNPKVKQPVEHISLSPSPADRELDEEEWEDIAQDLLEGMGMGKNQYIVVLHSDTEFSGQPRPHAHIVVNRINVDGRCADDSFERYRIQRVLREVEQKYSLTPVASSWEVSRAAETTGQVRRQRREIDEGKEPEPSIKRKLQGLCDRAAASNCQTISRYISRLGKLGVEARIKKTRTGKLQGISYEVDGVAYAGNKLGKAYSLNGLQKYKGLSLQESSQQAAQYQTLSRKRHDNQLEL